MVWRQSQQLPDQPESLHPLPHIAGLPLQRPHNADDQPLAQHQQSALPVAAEGPHTAQRGAADGAARGIGIVAEPPEDGRDWQGLPTAARCPHCAQQSTQQLRGALHIPDALLCHC
jgi:hypothetical protein